MVESAHESLPELAFYYPNPMWHSGDWIKNLILFFDGVALLLPDYMRGRPFLADPAITAGLEEHGLLKILEPETFIDQQATEQLTSRLVDILVSGALDDLTKDSTTFRALSYSRLGSRGDDDLAKLILDDLVRRGLAKPTEDGVSIPMHPMVRSLILVLLAQILRPTGKARGLDLWPATDLPEIQHGLTKLLGLPSMVSAGHVVTLDLEAVGVDLSAVPIEDVLGFRDTHGKQYRRYAQDLRRFVREIGEVVDPNERATKLRERRAEIADRAADLRNTAMRAWKRPTAFALSLAGAVWRLHSGDLFGSLLAGGSAVAGAQLKTSLEAGAFSYLFEAQRTLR